MQIPVFRTAFKADVSARISAEITAQPATEPWCSLASIPKDMIEDHLENIPATAVPEDDNPATTYAAALAVATAVAANL
eukprot:COSAG05_NODE_1412_length_4957_cov_50.130918_1_plen_79_part_00